MDFVALWTLRATVGLLNLFPLRVRQYLVSRLIRLGVRLVPRYRRIAHRNLSQAFPERDAKWREKIIAQSCDTLARVFVDFARLPELDEAWAHAHVAAPFRPRFEELQNLYPERGILIATGHLGSFELLAHAVAVFGFPLSFVVRPFKLKKLDNWWRSSREAYGNRAISRRGAFNEIIKELNSGRDVAILFDQNVTKNHAAFVDWFGHPAATTKTPALAALRTKAIVLVASISYDGNDKYTIHARECNFDSLYNDQALSTDVKVNEITRQISAEYQDMIQQNPGEWFWFHRRWKTAPEGVAEDFYR